MSKSVCAILLVEDDPNLHLLTKELLEDIGYNVHSAFNGAEAIEMIDNPRCAIDLVFTDVKMPGGISGFDVTKASRHARPGIPVLLTTGYSEDVLRSDVDYIDVEIIPKPARPKLLMQRVRELLGEAENS